MSFRKEAKEYLDIWNDYLLSSKPVKEPNFCQCCLIELIRDYEYRLTAAEKAMYIADDYVTKLELDPEAMSVRLREGYDALWAPHNYKVNCKKEDDK